MNWYVGSMTPPPEASLSTPAPPPTPPPAPTSRGLDADQLGAYFALMEVAGLLRHAVEQQLTEAGGLSYVQFQLLATLGDAPGGSARMTDLADGVVYSRSGMTYQAQVLEQRGLLTRTPSVEDERSVTATITDQGRAVLEQVFPGHVAALGELLFKPLSRTDVHTLGQVLGVVREHMRASPPRSATPRRRNKTTPARSRDDAG